MRIITWNVNGLADPKKARQMLRRLLSFKADIIVIQEVYKHRSKTLSKDIAKKIEDNESLAKYYWKGDMFFHPLGRISIILTYNNSLKVTIIFSDDFIIVYTLTPLP